MNLREQLVRDERSMPSAYQDSLGYWTIGVGHLIDGRKGGYLPPHIIDALLDYDIERVRAKLSEALPWWTKLDEARQGALLNMAFNLGIAGLLGFHNTLTLIEHGNYSAAAEEMLLSKWAQQVGARARRLAEQMRTGIWQ